MNSSDFITGHEILSIIQNIMNVGNKTFCIVASSISSGGKKSIAIENEKRYANIKKYIRENNRVF